MLRRIVYLSDMRTLCLLLAFALFVLSIRAAETPYVAPKPEGPVVTLLDEQPETLFPHLTNPVGGESGTISLELHDAFSGVDAVRVTPLQKYQSHILGWTFKIVEKPQSGEYRFLRFAWRKSGGSGVMIQLHDADKQGWGLRYYAGGNATGWESKSVAEKSPAEWQIVTRDLWKDFGAVTITGVAFTAMDGEAAWFDHLLLGRTVADLDLATDEALGRKKAARRVEGKERDRLWLELTGADREKAAAALRMFLATAPDQVAFIESKLPRPDPKIQTRVKKLIAEFEADAFATRQRAMEDLIAIGAPCLPLVRMAAKSTDAEVQYRAEKVLAALADSPTEDARATRVVRILERAASPAAKSLLEKLAAGDFGAEQVTPAKLALSRSLPASK